MEQEISGHSFCQIYPRPFGIPGAFCLETPWDLSGPLFCPQAFARSPSCPDHLIFLLVLIFLLLVFALIVLLILLILLVLLLLFFEILQSFSTISRLSFDNLFPGFSFSASE